MADVDKVTRIRGYLATEVAARAADENRSFANMVETLLEQALRMESPVKITAATIPVTTQPATSAHPEIDAHFKPDFGKKLK